MNRIEELEQIIFDANQELCQIKNECSHPVPCVTKKYSSNTGNMDKYDDSWTIHLHCELCHKKWSVSFSGHDEYNCNTKRSDYYETSRKYTREKK
jgi:hypothetical protein